MSLPALDIPRLLRTSGLHPDKSLGQNFLVDDDALHKVVRAAEISPEDVVLEIGPGLGSLTRYLATTARSVIAVEIDLQLIPLLNKVVSSYDNVQVVQGDILKLVPARLVPEPGYLVVANIPYYITSALIRHLIETDRPPRRLVLTVQQEVAERICAEPGDMSLLALSVQVYGRPEIVAHIPAQAFYPAPNVDSAVIRIDIYPEPIIPHAKLDLFFKLTKAGFSQKRKTLRNALSAGLQMTPPSIEVMLIQSGIDPMRRAETLSIPEWQQLIDAFISTSNPGS